MNKNIFFKTGKISPFSDVNFTETEYTENNDYLFSTSKKQNNNNYHIFHKISDYTENALPSNDEKNENEDEYSYEMTIDENDMSMTYEYEYEDKKNKKNNSMYFY